MVHSIPIGSKGRDIDHVVIGPSGAFAINTKYSPGRELWAKGWGLYVGGTKQNSYLQKLRADVVDTESRLSKAVGFTVPTSGLLVFVDPGAVTIGDPPDGDDVLWVILASNLVTSLHSSRRQLSDEQVNAIAAAAVQSGTWRASMPASLSGRVLDAEFEAFDAQFGERMRERIERAYAAGAASAQRAPAARRAPARTRQPSGQPRTPRRRGRQRASAGERFVRALLQATGGIVMLVVAYNVLMAMAKGIGAP